MDRGWRVGLRVIFRPLFAFGTIWAALLLFRGHVFGKLLPNSSPTHLSPGLHINLWGGVRDLLGYLFSNPVVLLVVLVFSWVCFREILRKQGLSRQLAVGCCLLPGLGIPLLMEEESFRAFRLYLPIWPLLCLVSAWAMPLLYNRLKKPIRRAAPVALLAAGWLIFALSPGLRHEFRIARQSREQGAVLARMFEGQAPLPRIAACAAGGYKVAYSGDVYDLTELPDSQLDSMSVGDAQAGNPVNREILNEGQPDIIIGSDSDGCDRSVLRELQAGPLFKRNYIKGELWYNDEIFFAYFSRRFIEGLQDGHYAFQQDLQYAVSIEDG
jgi:hypothetical protein